jgi:hypothetical protein
VAVVATLTKGYDLDYIWKQVDCGPVKDAASYYLQASETGGGGRDAQIGWNALSRRIGHPENGETRNPAGKSTSVSFSPARIHGV